MDVCHRLVLVPGQQGQFGPHQGVVAEALDRDSVQPCLVGLAVDDDRIHLQLADESSSGCLVATGHLCRQLPEEGGEAHAHNIAVASERLLSLQVCFHALISSRDGTSDLIYYSI